MKPVILILFFVMSLFANNVKLTEDEKSYLKGKKTIKMCVDPNWMPFEKIENGKHIGIASDYIRIISKQINTPIILVETLSWSESLEKAKRRECDIFSMASKTKQREEYMDFTSSYLDVPIIVATKSSEIFIDDLKKHLDEKWGIVQGYSLIGVLKKEFPNIQIVEVKSLNEGLEKVERGEILGFLGNSTTVAYEIQKNFLGSIAITGRLSNKVEFRIATRNDEKILNDIFNKSLLTMGSKTKQDILNRWTNIPTMVKIDYTTLWVTIGIFILLTLFAILYFINFKKTSIKIEHRLKIKLDKEVEKNRLKEEKLSHQSKLSQMLDLISVIGTEEKSISLKDSIKKITKISSEALNISRVSVWLYYPKKTAIYSMDIYSLGEDKHLERFKLEAKKHPLYFKELAKSEILTINDAQSSEITKDLLIDYIIPYNVKSMLDVPIKSEGKVIGFVSNKQINNIKKWSQDEIDFSKAMANTIALLWEIDKQKKADAKLQKEQNMLLSLFDTGYVVLFKWSNDEKFHIKTVSSNVVNIFEYSKEKLELEKKSYFSYIHKDDVGMVSSEIAQASKVGDKYFKHKPYRVINKSGKTRWVLDYTTIERDENGDISGYFGIIADITELKEKDNQLIQQSRLAQMGEMIGMIAHQWRQPLSAISSRSASLKIKAQLGKLDKDLIMREVDYINQYSQHLSQTINDFRDFFKKTKNKKRVTFNGLIKDVLNIIEISIINQNIKLIQNLNCNESFETYSNEVKQVVLNLLKNAEDVVLEKEIIDPYIKISTYKENDNYILEVSDNAGGVPESFMDKIFDPYFSTKLEKDGTGLGLYMSKTIIENHCEGKLTVLNNQDGAVFKISL